VGARACCVELGLISTEAGRRRGEARQGPGRVRARSWAACARALRSPQPAPPPTKSLLFGTPFSKSASFTTDYSSTLFSTYCFSICDDMTRIALTHLLVPILILRIARICIYLFICIFFFEKNASAEIFSG